MQKFLKNLFTAQRCRRAMFFLLFAAVMLLNSSPELRADALYLIADGDTVSVLDGTTDIPQERVIVTGAQSGDAEVTLPAGEKVTVTHGDDIEYATTRNGERVSELLRRLQISVSPLEMVLVDVTEEEVEITVASDFTYYETATEAAPHTTLTSTSYRIPKGETQVVQQGIDGTRDIVYEVVYADGQFVSRQAVEEKNDTSVAEITYTGTLVDKAQSGDTVKSVVTESDGSGYLLMKSGDSVHFSGSMKVTTLVSVPNPAPATFRLLATIISRCFRSSFAREFSSMCSVSMENPQRNWCSGLCAPRCARISLVLVSGMEASPSCFFFFSDATSVGR